MQDSLKIQRYLITVVIFSVISRANAYNYKDALDWGKEYKQCIKGNQSPIFIKEGEDGFPIIKQPLKLTNFDASVKNVTIMNTGHTVEVKATWHGKPPSVTGGPLHGKYVFEKITFHWDQQLWTVEDDRDDGYSHIPSYSAELEMHMFFYKENLKSFKKAETQKVGLAVISIGFLVVDPSSKLPKEFDQPIHDFDNLEKNLHKVKSPKSMKEIPPFSLTRFLGRPQQEPQFNFYEGSLDYPPCSESVTWFISSSEYRITQKLIDEFRKIKLTDGDTTNVRPTQDGDNIKVKTVNCVYKGDK